MVLHFLLLMKLQDGHFFSVGSKLLLVMLFLDLDSGKLYNQHKP